MTPDEMLNALAAEIERMVQAEVAKRTAALEGRVSVLEAKLVAYSRPITVNVPPQPATPVQVNVTPEVTAKMPAVKEDISMTRDPLGRIVHATKKVTPLE